MMANNDDALGRLMNLVVAYTVLDELLGLEPRKWEEVIMGQELRNIPNYPDPPPNHRPAPSDLSGRYHNDGYDTIDLHSTHTLAHHQAVQAIMSKPTQPDWPVKLTEPMYYTALHKGFTDGLIFTHFDGPIFNWTAFRNFLILDKKGEETDEWTMSFTSSGSAVFSKEEHGFGMFGGFWGQGGEVDDLPVVEEDVEQRSEVWYARAKS